MMSDGAVPETNPNEINVLHAVVVKFPVIRTNSNLCILKFTSLSLSDNETDNAYSSSDMTPLQHRDSK